MHSPFGSHLRYSAVPLLSVSTFLIPLPIPTHRWTRNAIMENTIDGIGIEFITGNDPNLTCTRRIGGGGYGRVYEVLKREFCEN